MEKNKTPAKPQTSVNSDDSLLTIKAELDWLRLIIEKRALEADKKVKDAPYVFDSEIPQTFQNDTNYYGQLIRDYNLNSLDRILLISALATQIAPQLFGNELEGTEKEFIQDYSEFGGFVHPVFKNFVPTFKTILFLSGANNLTTNLQHRQYFANNSVLIKEQIIDLKFNTEQGAEQLLHSQPTLASEYLNYLISGEKARPDFGKNFPATLITTGLNWEDLVVPENTLKELQRIGKWHASGNALIAETKGKLNGSFTCLFYGASGSGKTLAVQLLGKSLGKDVFRIDLSMVVSKYIGETEKNLAYLFDRAKNKNWILFFDEADALFGKRTEIKDSKDKWANLEMSYLLQRMEEHNGLTILATNFRNNLDVALSRRFQSVIYFAKPDKAQRRELWRKLMPAPYVYETAANLDVLASFELTGGNIINILKAACLDAKHSNQETVLSEYIVEALKREFAKENRIVTQ